MVEQETYEPRDGGRRWYDNFPRSGFVIAYCSFTVVGAAMGCLIGFIIGRLSCKGLPW